MSDIWLVQYLCPQRHAIAAVPYERPADEAEIEGRLLAEMQRLYLDPRCGICGSRELHFEHRKLPATDWDMAIRQLRAVEKAQLVTRVLIDARKADQN